MLAAMRFDVIDVAGAHLLALHHMQAAPGLSAELLGAEPAPGGREIERPPGLLGPPLGIVTPITPALGLSFVHRFATSLGPESKAPAGMIAAGAQIQS